MQVSRAVVNSGFEVLERQGFIEVRPGFGVHAADYTIFGNIETLIAIMEYNGDQIKDTEIRSILEFLRAPEHPAVVGAAFSFHHEMASSGNNSILPLLYISFKPAVIKLRQRYCSLYGREQLYINTRELYDCLARRDAPEAGKCTDRHLDDAISGRHRLC